MKRQDTLSAYQFHEMFPDEASAVTWFESVRWPESKHCPHCGSENIADVKSRKPQPYRCRTCRKHFSARTGTVMQSSHLPVRKWLYAMYLMSVSRKGLSSLQLARELSIAQEAAWRLGHKIREAWNDGALFPMTGMVEVDETYIGGKERNKHSDKKHRAGRGPVGKQVVLGIRLRETGEIRAFPIDKTDGATLKDGIRSNVAGGSTVYTDCHKGYRGMREYRHEAVAHSAGEYVRGEIHTNGIESFWALLKRSITGSYHYISVKHLSRYVDEFCYRQNRRDRHALDTMAETAARMAGRRLSHFTLVNGEGA